MEGVIRGRSTGISRQNRCRWLPVSRSRVHRTYLKRVGAKRKKHRSVIRCDTSKCKRHSRTWQPHTHQRCLRCGPPGCKQTLTGIWIYTEMHIRAALMNTATLFCFLYVAEVRFKKKKKKRGRCACRQWNVKMMTFFVRPFPQIITSAHRQPQTLSQFHLNLYHYEHQ